MSQYTPGPWSLTDVMDDEEDGQYRQVRAGRLNETLIADVIVGQEFLDGESNARLIVAATDLLVALQAMRSHWLLMNRPETDEIARAVLAVADNALAKAEGRLTAQERTNA